MISDRLQMSLKNPIFRNHKAYGQELLPGLAYIDLIFQIFRKHGYSYRELELRRLSIYKPLIVGQDYDVILSIKCSEVKPGQWEVLVEGREQRSGILAADKIRYVTAEMHRSGVVEFGERLDPDLMKRRAKRIFNLSEMYEQCRLRELVHTGLMKAEGEVYEGDGAVFIDIVVGPDARSGAAGFMFHPALIDGSVIGSREVFSSLVKGEPRLFLPLFYESFRASALLRERCITRIQTSSLQRKKELLYVTMEFFNESGEKMGELKHLISKLVRGPGFINPNRDKSLTPTVSLSTGPGSRSIQSFRDHAKESVNEAKTAGTTAPLIEVESFLRQLLADRLEKPVDQIDPQVGYYEMGLDSSGILGIVQAIEAKIGTSLPPTLLFEYTTIEELAAYLTENYTSQFPLSGQMPLEPEPIKSFCGVQGRFFQKEPLAAGGKEEEPIAIIGMAGRYPGARNLREFWKNLKEGKDCITEIPKTRWDWQRFEGLKSPSGKGISRWGGFIDNVDCFDAQFFRISPMEAEVMDPQERLFLETCWEAIEDAGYTSKNLVLPRGPRKRRQVGVFVGVMHKDYTLVGAEAAARGEVFPLSLNDAPIANRVSYFFNFHGPSMAIDTVCSSSLTALHLALESIYRGESQVALAGGVNLSLHPGKYMTYGMMDMHSSDGYCHTFGKGGDGYVSGEGVGVVLLKPLPQAVAARDHIYAVIKGSAVNHGGRVSGLTVPNPTAQADMIQACLEKTGLHPRTITYVETHGTGTSLGDPIEVRGLVQAYSPYTVDRQFCAIGSVKSNIGHAESAAGIAGLTKTVLQLYYKTLVPSLHSRELNPYIDFKQSPFYVQQQTGEWKQPIISENRQKVTYPRRAGLSSVGASGSNAHVILEEYLPSGTPLQILTVLEHRPGPVIIPLSARDKERLRAYAGELLSFLQGLSLQENSRPGLEKQEIRLKEILEAKIRRVLAAILHVEEDDVDVEPEWNEYGVEPFHMAQTREKLHEKLGIEIDIKQMEPGSSIASLAAYLVNHYQDALSVNTLLPGDETGEPGIKPSGSKIRLTDIAYTLQVGREAMEERVVFMGSTIPELMQKLEAFSQNREDIEHCYRGQARPNHSTAALITTDEDSREFIHKWIRKGRFDKIARVWADGGTIDWELLAGENQPVRISLPTYPFARERYWVTGFDNGVGSSIKNPDLAVRQDDTLVIKTQNAFEIMTFKEEWQEQALPDAPPAELNTVVCFLSDPGYQQAAGEAMQALSRQVQVIFISRGTGCKKQSPQQYSIDHSRRDTYEEAFQSIRTDWGQVDALLYPGTLEDPGNNRDYSCIVYLLQAVASTALKVGRLILAASFANELDRCFLESWLGFERSLGFVLLHTRVAAVLQDKTSGAQDRETAVKDWLQILRAELQTPNLESVLYQGGRRYVCRVRPTTPAAVSSPVKPGGTYLVTGGCGGLGLLFARHFAETHPLNLVLTGRSPLDREKKSKIKALEDLGSRVLYLQADVSAASRMKEELNRAKERFGDIHGVVHAAGIQGRQTLFEKDFDAFQKVIEPKIRGTLVLDELLQDEPLDFTCYFSSSSAILGDFGSCDYAIGSRFQMAYAHYRAHLQALGQRRGKTIAINWPLWQEGGMGFTDARMTEMVLESSGQGFLQTRDGLALFDRLLAQDYPQHLVIVGQPGRVHRFLGLTEDRPAGTPPGISGASSGTRSEKREGLSLEQQLQRDLQEHIGQVLKLPVERLRTDQILADFGFDSIRLTELASRLTGYYHIEITPSVFFGHSTIEKLVRYFLTQHEEAIYEFYREGEAGEAAPAAPGWSESQKSGFAVKGDNHGVPGPLEPIAVIGMSGRFPLADTVEEFWRNLAEGKDCIREIPAERWDWRQYSREQGRAADIINCKWGGFLTGIDRFDPLFFEIAPKEAGFMDPKQRLFLEEAWHALEDAGYMGERIRGSLCGVYAGVEEGEYGFLKGESGQVYNSQNATLSARIAYTLDLKGPNFALTAACSSGLVAVHQACLALRHGECEIALAGGIHLMISPRLYVELNRLGLLSPEGKCRVFDWRANGLVPGEAAVVLVLKPLSRAIADKDHIYGCIKASGVNYDGKTNGITAPNPLSQAELIQGIYNKYHIDPAHIQYVLAHSTGSKLGDSLEIEAFTAAFGKYTDLKKFCSIGSIKPLIGHTFAASGIVSLIGMLMAMKHRIIPGLPYFESPNEHIDFKKSPFRVHQENQPWTAVNHRPRVGVIGTTGMSGTNAHAVIEEYLPPPGETGHTFFSPSSQVVVLSAWSPERLQAAVRQMLDFLRQESTPGARLGDIAYTLQIGREAMKERVALVVSSKQELSQRLETFLSLPPGDFPVNKIFTGSSDAPGAGSVEPVPSGKEPKLLVREALAERDPEPLARLWVKGTPVPWEQWHKNQPVRVISLPTYPFKKRRCWFSAGQRDYPGEKPGMTPDTAALAEMLKEDHIPYNKSSKNITAAIPHEAAPQPGTGLGERDESQEPGASLESLQGIFVTVLGLQPEELEEASTFKELGVSSINAVELVEAINKEFNLHLPTSMMLACNNLEAVAAHIENARRAVKSVDQTFQTFDSLAGKPEDIAIIGLSCRCAGARGQEEFWELVSQGKSSIKEIKNKSWLDFFRFNSKTRTPTRYGALEDQEYFDPLFFNISPKEAEAMDVAQRIILEEIYKALEDSGYSPSRLREQAVGTIIGTMGNTSNLADENFSHFALLGSDTSILSSRIAYFLDLKGPALAVNTACSSSLVAIDIACQKLKIHDIDLAIAGGITIFTHPGGFIPMHQAGMLSPTGECRPFDQEANGTVVGDGVGIVILKRFSEARRDNDPIYGIIRGSGTNQDGQTSGITVPNFLAQSQLEESIYRKNQICVDDLQYIEAHGTGTKLGDPIEVHALSHSFSQFTARKGFCALGSLKANIGHTTAAAGVLGLIKVLLSLKNRQIPPALNFTKKNEHIDFENSPFFVNTSLKDWPPNSRGSRLAAVSSFGFSGTNAHLVVEEGPAVSTSAASRISESIPGVLTISAENEAILRQYARDIREFLRTHRDIALEDFFYTFQVGREAMSCRLALVAGNKEKLPEQLEQFLGGQVKKTVGIYMGTVSKKESLDLGDTAEGKEFLQQLARHHQAAKLAQLWVKGNTIDWESLYRAGSARRLAGLPTYPFARERWRVPGSDIAAGGRQMAIAAAAAYLHPLLHGNTSDFREQRFSSTFTGREFFLADHMVKGQPVLPGVAYLEMVRAAVEIASASPAPGQAGIRLKNVVWIRPLVVTHQPVRVHIALFPDDRGEITFEIYGGPAADGQEPVVYCQGSALPGSGRKVKPLDLQALAAECNRASLSAHQCLAAFRTMGIDYGPAHQGIEQVYVGERQVLAKLSLPSAAAETPDQFILHPSLMDSAWQASIGLVMGPGDSPFPEGSAGLKPTLPFALQELEIFSPCTPAMWALLRLAGGSPAGDKVRKLDIHLSDETGKICVRLKGLSARVWEPAGNPAQQQGSLLNEQPGTPDPTLPAAPAAAGDLLQEKALHYFKYLLAPIINLPVDRIDADAPMEKYGIDSIMIVQLNNQLEKIFGSLSKTLFFEYRDLRELTGYFLEFHRDRLMGLPGIREEAGAVSVGGSSALETMRQKSVPRSPGRRDFASWRSRARGENSTGALDIAIIGLSGRYPQAGNTREFWENLREGKDCITEIPADRWDHSLYFDRDRNKPGKTYSKWGGFLDGVDRFDSLFFNISPLEAELMDPQERLFLECVYETLEDAGYTRETLALHRGFGLSGNVGVYVGVMYEEYQFYGVQEQVRGRPMAFSGNPSSIANRVSYFFNFHGPSMAVDTMCSSSLTAIYLGCQSLQRGECELAVAGGVNVSIHPNKYLLLAQGRFVSGKGRCESFGQGGDGFVPGEGVGAVLLKPLSEAVIDGDHIYGIIKAAAINHGGKTNGYTVPNPNAQASVIGRAFKQAGIHPRTVSYLEAHGTGTFLGDPVEITGLTKAFGEYTKDNQFCHIGSVKSNIGHCESAAGIAGLTKVLLQLRYGQLVPSLHAAVLNPNIDFSNTPFVVQQRLAEWKPPQVEIEGELREYPRIAGISSFGAGGSNAHLVIQEYIPGEPEPLPLSVTTPAPAVIVLSAKKEEQLRQQAQRLLGAITTPDQPFTDDHLGDIAYTLQLGREALEERLAMTVKSLGELREKLQGFLEGGEGIENLYRGRVKENQETLAGSSGSEAEAFPGLWVKGLAVDWNKLYVGNTAGRPRRVSLPTYPFARQRCWVPGSGTDAVVRSPAAASPPAAAPREDAPASSMGTHSTLMLAPVWDVVPAPEGQIFPPPGGNVVIVGGTREQRSTIRQFYPHGRVLNLRSGDSVKTMIKKLEAYAPVNPIDHIAWIAPSFSWKSLADDAIIQEQDRGVLSCFRLIKALLHLGYGSRVLGWSVITVQAQSLHQNDAANPAHAGLHGLVGSLAKEYPQWKIRLIDLEDGVAWPIAEIFTLPPDPLGNALLHRNRQWYRQQLIPLNNKKLLRGVQGGGFLEKSPPGQTKYKPKGVYVVIGGAGGIGEAWSEYMIRAYQARIIWIGRRPKDAAIEAKLARLAALGPAPHYIAADATRREPLQQAYEEIKQRYAHVNGVIHSAIVLLDKSLANMEEEQFQAAFSAKAAVSVRIAQVFPKDLDFVLFFSSLLAFTKNPGQSNYASGCTFMDAFAHRLAREWPGSVKTMNWGYWGSVGVVATNDYRERMTQAGIGSIEPPEAMEALETLLAAPMNQMALIKTTRPLVME